MAKLKILHYSLGFPPYRSGGLTKFCTDLMKEQIKEGYDVSLLWPGEIKFVGHATRIKKGKLVNGIGNYEVVNPLPVSYDEGIRDIDAFMQPGDIETYARFLAELKPDVIHIHTLMGLHMSLLEVAKELGIRLVFTTHDFYPICPKVTLFRHGQICSSIETCDECGTCNISALSLKKIQILQSPLYRGLKDAKIVKKIRKRHRDKYLGIESDRDAKIFVGTTQDYLRLRSYYQKMLAMMSAIHFNSSIAKNIYKRVVKLPESHVISITHADISDRRKCKNYSKRFIRIRYLGPQGEAKGFFC